MMCIKKAAKKLFSLAAVFILFAAYGCNAAAPVTVEYYLEPMNSRSWQGVFVMQAMRGRFGNNINATVAPIVQKDNNAWVSRYGENDVQEAKRMAVLSRYRADVYWNYLQTRLFDALGQQSWEDAAAFAGLTADELNKLVQEKGNEALEYYYAKIQKHNIVSPTFLVNDELYTDQPMAMPLASQINKLLTAKQQVNLVQRPKSQYDGMKVWVVTDPANPYTMPDGQVLGLVSSVLGQLNPEFVQLTPQELQKDALLKDFRVDFLPAYVMVANPEAERLFSRYIAGGYAEKQGKYIFIKSKGSSAVFLNKKRVPRQLEIFTMAQCNFCLTTLESIIQAKDKGTFPKDVTLKINYVVTANKTPDGRYIFSSLRGTPEWEEDIRQLLVNKYYPDKFWEYIRHRHVDPTSTVWETAAKKAGIDIDKINSAFDKEGKELLYKNSLIALDYGIDASPTFVWEGNTIIPGFEELKKLPGFEKLEVAQHLSGR